MHNFNDQIEIGNLIRNWSSWRDSGKWELLRAAMHPDAVITTTWFEGNVEGFIQACQASWRKGTTSRHVLGGTTVEINGRRALAQTGMAIRVRAPLEGVEVEVICTGRFFDRVEKRNGGWRIARRNLIYEHDRLAPIQAGAKPDLDRALLERFPEGYRHLGYLQSKQGGRINPNLPTARGAALENLLRDAKTWLNAAQPAKQEIRP